MRFNSASLAVVFGIVGTACAAPMDAASANSPEARGLPLHPVSSEVSPFKFPITYSKPSVPAKYHHYSDLEDDLVVMVFLKAVSGKFSILKEVMTAKARLDIKPTNTWEGERNTAEFTFRLPECGDKPCHARVVIHDLKTQNIKEAKITAGDGSVLFTK